MADKSADEPFTTNNIVKGDISSKYCMQIDKKDTKGLDNSSLVSNKCIVLKMKI